MAFLMPRKLHTLLLQGVPASSKIWEATLSSLVFDVGQEGFMTGDSSALMLTLLLGNSSALMLTL